MACDYTRTAPQPSAEVTALIERLARAVDEGPPATFEQSVCDAFQMLGFASTHVGGLKAPDGYVDAMLGPLSYRATIECKSGDEALNDPSVFEAAKFKEPYSAQYCALIGRAFSGEIELVKELQNHGVSAWTVDDLQQLLRIDANPFEIRPLFEPGFAADGLDDLLWERRRGRAKRVASLLRRSCARCAPRRQPTAVPPPRHRTSTKRPPCFSSTRTSSRKAATCDREDVRAAIEYLANPLVRLAVRDPADGSIVVIAN